MSQVSACDFFLIKYRGPLLIPFGIPTQVFFSDTRHQKQSLASLYEYFGNAVAGKKPKLGNKMELLEVPYRHPFFLAHLFGFLYHTQSLFRSRVVFKPLK
jgi:hypothetical protein